MASDCDFGDGGAGEVALLVASVGKAAQTSRVADLAENAGPVEVLVRVKRETWFQIEDKIPARRGQSDSPNPDATDLRRKNRTAS